MITIPAPFARLIVELHEEKGRDWLARLPTILARGEQRWGLTLGIPFPNLSFHFVVPAVRTDGTPVVLKAHAPTGEFAEETRTLRLFDGHGMVRLLADSVEDEVVVLEYLRPGTSLREIKDDVQAISIAAAVMKRLWRPALKDDVQAISIAATVMKRLWQPAPKNHMLATTAGWGKGFLRLRQRYNGGNGPFPQALLEEAETLFTELSASMAIPMLLHGDLHQDNILASERNGWIAIDPKGLVGEPAYETGAILRNFFPELLTMPDPQSVLARRIDQFAEELNVDRVRVRGWGLSQAVLAAWWSVEDSGQVGENALLCAEWLAKVKV